MRDLSRLPKAHLHLHFTGSLRVATLTELALERGARLPSSLTGSEALSVPADKRGWFRFQRQYDIARSVVKGEGAVRRLIREAAIDDAAEGSRRLELQVEPSSYARELGGLTPTLEIILDEAALASRDTGVDVGIIVAASRIRHPLDARTLARLAARYAGDGPGQVVGFGLSNDERTGITSEWAAAFAIALRAGLPAMPHGGELLGPEHLREVVAHLHPSRIGHGVRSADDPELLAHMVADGIAFEVCPVSNVSLGVYADEADVPLRQMFDAGAQIALGADDPLLFRSRLVDQYEIARGHGFSDAELAELARASVRASTASDSSKRAITREIDAWLAEPDPLS
ncbi:adenosine deaminase [Ruaniaceae bacterium KH17]|nr:adenosine deaminase [Ruaniaceae bacterium KH17]